MDAKETQDLLIRAATQATEEGPFNFFAETGLDMGAVYDVVSEGEGPLQAAIVMTRIQQGYELARILGFPGAKT